ncbi:hypothetical protein [Pedobacter sp. L105]|uniref:hypothetical protein n=1 Tax=Pedobacter sp. L105 TaxID=1641871 RepID=UPI00131B414B|nr:hypothetical protein [Pedobacter sp. L105]
MTGFCRPSWKRLDENNELINDVEIGDYKLPWNVQEGLTGMRKGIPKSQFWAYDEGGGVIRLVASIPPRDLNLTMLV